MIPDFEGIKVEEIDSADILLERLRAKPQVKIGRAHV
jgi:hypothetical protein